MNAVETSSRIAEGHRAMRISALRDGALFEQVVGRLMEGTEFDRDEALIVLAMCAEAFDHYGVTFTQDRILLQEEPIVYRRASNGNLLLGNPRDRFDGDLSPEFRD